MKARSVIAGVSLALASLGSGHAALAADPLTSYRLYCMGCHVADGSGLQGKVPSLRETLVPLARLAEGRRYLVQVPGAAQSPLSDADLAALLNWMIRTLPKDSAATVQPFTPAEVSRYRARRLVEVRDTRARLLARIQRDSKQATEDQQ